MAFALTGSSLSYGDLISAEDREFWQYLCKKDFRRLEKLMTQNIGEGHFIDDSGEDESEEEEGQTAGPRKQDGEGSDGGDNELGDAEDGGLGGFLAARDRGAGDRRRGNVRRRGPREGENEYEEDDENADVDNWLQIDDKKAEHKELQEQIAREADELARKEEGERAAFTDNNYWREGSSLEAQFDLDKLMEEME